MKHKLNRNIVILLNAIYLVLISYNVNILVLNKNYKNESNLIKYSIVAYKEHSGGKGNHYDMDVLFNDKVTTLSLTGKEYNDIKKGVYPNVYLTKKNDLLTDWSYEQRKRYIYVFLILMIFTNIAFYLNRKRTKKINF